MKVRLTRDTVVRFPAGTVLDVSENEASRLSVLGVAERIAEQVIEDTAKTAKVETAVKRTKKTK